MLKVVVFDGGYGGELFADKLRDEIQIIEVIRVIDWRNADKLLSNAKAARKVAREALLPYIGKVDLIVLANHLLTITSLKYFRRKYKNQKFVGFHFKTIEDNSERKALILTTKAITKTVNYYNYLFHLKSNVKTLVLDDWLAKIDDGELGYDEIKRTVQDFLNQEKFQPNDVILACAQFNDIKRELRRALGWNVKIHDSFDDAVKKVCHALNLRGGSGKKSD